MRTFIPPLPVDCIGIHLEVYACIFRKFARKLAELCAQWNPPNAAVLEARQIAIDWCRFGELVPTVQCHLAS